MSNINIFALGGQDENGKDLYVLEVENDIFVINAGMKFPINDMWGVDGIIADTTYLQERKDRIKGIFITHAHDESFAALAWFLMDIPGAKVYSSNYTNKLIQNRISKYKIGHTNYQFSTIKESQKFGNVIVRPLPTASSIPGSLAWEFQTPDGAIVFASELTIGDLGPFGNTDLSKWPKNPLLLMLDSRKANFNESSFAKKSIKNIAEKVFAQSRDDERIIFGGYDEEMYTLQEIIDLANAHNRPIAFYGSAYDLMYQILVKNNSEIKVPKNIISYKNVNNVPNAVILVTGTWSRIYQRFNRIAENNDVYLKLRASDKIIMATPPRNGMEVVYSQALDAIAKLAPNITDITDKDFFLMRPTKVDIKNIVKTIKPKFFVPISSLYRYQVVANKAAIEMGVRKNRALLLQNGKVLYFQDGELASQKGKVKNIKDVIIQGFGYGDISYEVIKERKSLSAGGLISIVAQFNKATKQLVGDINIHIIGLVVKTELNQYIELINSIVIQKFEEAPKLEFREIQNAIRKRIQKQVKKLIDKEPLVVITFYEV